MVASGQASGGRGGAWLARRGCLALAVASLALAWPGGARAVSVPDGSSVDAPGLTGGPFITDAGLAWDGKSAVMLTSRAGRSRVLAKLGVPDREFPPQLGWFGSDWWAQARASGVFAGRIGGALHELRALRRCNPDSLTPPHAEARYAIAGARLYAALPASCFSNGKPARAVVLEIELPSRRERVLARLGGRPEYIAASGDYVAVAYARGAPPAAPGAPPPRTRREQQLFVRVLNAATGALVSQVTPPPSLSEWRGFASAIQVDDRGDVLVTPFPGDGELFAFAAQPPERRSVWWWAKPGARVGHEARLGRDAVLSNGRVAFLSYESHGAGAAPIVVTDLLNGSSSTVVAFAGTVHAENLAFDGDTLAWAQQSTVVEVTNTRTVGGGGMESCGAVALTPVELATLDLRRLGSRSILVSGAPIPPQYANEPPCRIS